ncbi:TetR/AcrR family transcriptional regulator [Arthrobacter zhangbolii]|uniref:TetR/AcrR family transcriptional regulator n=1 Tax=Arthrobacter zhangbolii TaxID=2886936 RepID=A0A9X1M8B5_9MICC|nr:MULTISPECIES: TetR/AcrR family transcriptional regulator [Arthrobacter]MCC3272194.1 TetR/AcrR family transcriptional regulator [Arthrobacter zhangbolii]MCC3294331.1 TetR/AcrR family transcriptional regulator [Arthrobacter zhangbolii]MDN3903248.1 TetR/AcrR family transcriptional regulator [Arthrobacter sp. YD2]UON91934.1 TetR/AcrR family transcriptional regulator [Arthrobacter zhangbolii]
MFTNATPDRRQALKDRHRQAIVTAAAALMHERQTTDFTVDELAQRADVSRRTVFNHFGSVRDIVSEVCSGVLSTAVESLTAVPQAGDDRPGMFEEIAEAFRTADLVAPMAYLTRLLGPALPASPEAQAHPIALRAFTELNERFSASMLSRYPEADGLSVDLLIGSLTSGLGVLYHHWHCATGAVDTPESRQVWAELLDTLLEKVRSGHAADPSSPRSLHP